MRRFLAALAEIAGGCHQSLAKMPLPDAVHDTAAGERVSGSGDPAGEGGAALGFRGFVRPEVGRQRVHPANGSGRDFVLRRLGVAAREYLDHRWFSRKYAVEFRWFAQRGEFLFQAGLL